MERGSNLSHLLVFQILNPYMVVQDCGGRQGALADLLLPNDILAD